MIIKLTSRFRIFMFKTLIDKIKESKKPIKFKTLIDTIKESKKPIKFKQGLGHQLILISFIVMMMIVCSIRGNEPKTLAQDVVQMFKNTDIHYVIEMSSEPRVTHNTSSTGNSLYSVLDAFGQDRQPTQQILFDDNDDYDNLEEDDEETSEDDEEFYPSDHKIGSDTDVKVMKSDFKIDFDDHKALNRDNFYSSYRLNKTATNKKEPNVSSSVRHENTFGMMGRKDKSSRKEECAFISERGGCITFGAVEWAIQRAKRILKFRKPNDLNSAEPSESAINMIGELNELTTRILAIRFHLTWDEIIFGSEQIDIRGTSLWDHCPAIFRSPPNCTVLSRYRTHTGQCNNLIWTHFGSSNMPFVRILPPDYSDSVGAPRSFSGSFSGPELPPVRLLSLNLHPNFDNPSLDESVLFMNWGQLIIHDLALASGARIATGHNHPCCSQRNTDVGNNDRVCMPIQIGTHDPLYSRHGTTCHEFKRSLAGLRPGCSLGPRTQLNTITSFIDASFVYGSSRSTSASLRTNNRGLLEMWNYFGEQGLKALLPPQISNPDEECVGRNSGRFCFRSGDSRTNQQIQLAVLHTVHTRQHNRLAEALGQVNPHWTDNKIYHEARHIHIAIIQHILINEYLPTLLGRKFCTKYNLTESTSGTYWNHYNPNVNPGISHAFAAAAFRQGHTMVPSQVFKFDNEHQFKRVYQLRKLFRQPWPLFEPGAMDQFLLGLVNTPGQSFDPFISSDLSGHLFESPNEQVGFDLAAINIQRGRDQGVPGYNAFRDWCGLGRLGSFDELNGFMSMQSVQMMATFYDSVDDIDLFSAGISEFPQDGALLGPTFTCIIGRQFESLRSGDRFWFESSLGPQAFTLAQLDSIKQVSLARIICANSDNIITIQQLAFRMAHPILNPRQFCDSLPDIDLTLWFDPNQRQLINDLPAD